MNNKTDFITAYMYLYGATKAEAVKAYKTATPGYISAIIDSMKQDTHKAFFED